MAEILVSNIDENSHLTQIINDYFDNEKVIEKIKTSSKIIIKVSMPSDVKTWQAGVIVQPDIVLEIVNAIFKANKKVKVHIVESSLSGRAEKAFINNKYYAAFKSYSNVHLHDLDLEPSVKITSPNFKKIGIVTMPILLTSYDMLIAISVPKRHIVERYSGVLHSLVNLIGDSAFRDRLLVYPESVADVYSLHKPDIAVLDCRIGLVELGPIEGIPKRFSKIVIGRCSINVDVEGCKLFNEYAKKVSHIRKVCNREKISIQQDKIREKAETFVPELQNIIWRVASKIQKFGDFIIRISDLSRLGSFALLATGFTDIVTGRWIAIPRIISMVYDIVFKLNMMPKIIDKRVVINKHIKDQSVS